MNKDEQAFLEKFYTDIFLDISDYKNFEKEDIRTYVDHEEPTKYYYTSPVYKLTDSNRVFRFFIFKSSVNIRLEVRLYDNPPKEAGGSYIGRTTLFRDVLNFKGKSHIKSMMTDIMDFVEHKIFLRQMGNDKSYSRKVKITKLIKGIKKWY